MSNEHHLRGGHARDPVCGMTVDPVHAAAEVEHAGTRYFFCSTGCAAKFRADPTRYVTTETADPGAMPRGSQPAAPPPARRGTTYTCPMHPEIIRDKPGACPICGMALEPVTPAPEDEENAELVDMRRRFWVSTLLTLPVVAIAMRHILPRLAHVASPALLGWLELALATPVVLWGGWPFFVRAWRSVVTWNLNMYTLIGLGVAVAYTYSVVAHLFPAAFPASFRDHAGFHEQCVERIFNDIKQSCRPEKLSVFARYTRRGGLDINPFRSDFETAPTLGRLIRQ